MHAMGPVVTAVSAEDESVALGALARLAVERMVAADHVRRVSSAEEGREAAGKERTQAKGAADAAPFAVRVREVVESLRRVLTSGGVALDGAWGWGWAGKASLRSPQHDRPV